MMHAVIVEDEPLAQQRLASMLAETSDVRVVARCNDGPAAVQAIVEHKPDVLFLDIEMPGANGFEVLEAIGEDADPIVIFTTAYGHHAVKAFEAHALDYLLKPFDEDRLHKALVRARQALSSQSAGDQSAKTRNLLADDRVRELGGDRLVVKSGGRVLFLDQNEVDWVEAAANYVKLHCGQVEHVVRETMGGMEKRLDPAKFTLIHRSIIVNVGKLRELRTLNSGEFILTMSNGTELSGSRNYRSAVQRYLKPSKAN